MSGTSAWGKSWLNSWLNSWGKTEEPHHSGWFRLWLTKAQEKANAERNASLEVRPVVAQGQVVVPKMVKAAAKKTRQVVIGDKTTVKISPVETQTPVFVLDSKIPQLLDQPLPDYSVSEFTKALDFQKHQQHKKQRRQREDDALILLLAA